MKLQIFRILVLVRFLGLTSHQNTDFDCEQLSQSTLSVILGQAFNPRYMSIEPPKHVYSVIGAIKRATHEMSFYGDKDIVSVGDFPAWDTNHMSYFEETKEVEEPEPELEFEPEPEFENIKEPGARTRRFFVEFVKARNELFNNRPWECRKLVNWIDLGPHYFPRYIRSIACKSKRCWYDHFKCEPKSFTIKVLRRREACTPVSDKLSTITATKFEKSYTELWTWEERAVSFCCECVMKHSN